MQITLLIFFGIAGTLARYGLQGLVQYRTGPGFPSGTLVVNLIGCFLLGGVGQFALNHLSNPPEWRVGLTVGFFGAFMLGGGLITLEKVRVILYRSGK